MKTFDWKLLCVMMIALVACGCVKETAKVVETYDASKFLLAAEPDGAVDVAAARESVEDKDEVVIVGRIGGSIDPWVKGRAAFSLVDPALLACSDEKEEGEECSCKTPWDYCCESDKLPDAMVLVTFVETDGSVVKHDAKANFGVKELDTVIVKGKAERDETGNFTVRATGMFVRK